MVKVLHISTLLQTEPDPMFVGMLDQPYDAHPLGELNL
jgi:hypothetical protein